MSDQIHWKHSWPSAQVLAQFLVNNSFLVKEKIVLELGSGCTGIVGLTAGKLGAKAVIHTDHPDIKELPGILQRNIVKNRLQDICSFIGLDWNKPENFAENLKELDILVASDVFFDPSVFSPLLLTISQLIGKFPNVAVYFAYQNRDDTWTISDLLALHNLSCSLIRSVDTELHNIQLGVIYKATTNMIFGGIEGGASFSKLVFLNEKGDSLGESHTKGTNYYLNGVEQTANDIATWVREAKKEIGINGPLMCLGMGLSGAEDPRLNEQFIEYLQAHHGDVAEHFNLTSDAVSTIAGAFHNGGICIIAGTGSSCRLLTSSGEMFGVGGWGHAVGDGGSGYWTTNRALRILFDVDDGLEQSEHSIEPMRKLLHEHFDIDDKVQMLDFLYAKFNKAHIATFTEKMAEHVSDPVIAGVFYQTGFELGRHLAAISRHMEEEMRKNVPIVAVGSVFKSWSHLKKGFSDAVRLSSFPISRVTIYRLCESNSFGAAVLAASQKGIQIPFHHEPDVVDTVEL